MIKEVISSVFIVFFVSSCGQMDSKEQMLSSDKSQVELRQFQAKSFDTKDQKKTMRTVIATLQDLGFVIDKADAELGTVSGTKLSGYSLRMTISVTPKEKSKMVVRASAQYNVEAVEDPRPYQQFFAALEKAMFLKAQDID